MHTESLAAHTLALLRQERGAPHVTAARGLGADSRTSSCVNSSRRSPRSHCSVWWR
ncbi:hypothetical protein ABZT17_22720 [Streptomyces sp. NPDC005648]|uniref:hypothetical protein n=1 Tax=Streptomyces sp. NPDC005648 TaxID=3157044 RepID=UPI0033A6892C